MLEEQVVSTREDNETGFGDACGQLATRLEGSYGVVPHMHDKRRRLHFGQKISDIEIAQTSKYRAAHSGEVVFRHSSLK